jgi:hypothetical protein
MKSITRPTTRRRRQAVSCHSLDKVSREIYVDCDDNLSDEMALIWKGDDHEDDSLGNLNREWQLRAVQP